MKLKNIPPVPAVLLSIISVQGGAAIAKGIFPIMGAAGTVSLRIVLSAILLLAVYRPSFKSITPIQWKWAAIYGLALGIMNTTFYLSLSRIPLGLAVTLEFLGPLVLAISTSRKAIDFLWAFMAAVGIALIAPWHSNSDIDLIGAGLALLAGAFWAAYIILGSKVTKLMDSGQAVSIGLIFASCIALPAALIEGNLGNISPNVFLLGMGIALLSSAIPYTLEMNALKHIPAKTFSILMSLEPAAAALCGLVFLHEHLSILEWTTIALVVAASTGSTLTKSKTTSSIDV